MEKQEILTSGLIQTEIKIFILAGERRAAVVLLFLLKVIAIA